LRRPRQKRSNDKPILKINFSINYDKRFRVFNHSDSKKLAGIPFNT